MSESPTPARRKQLRNAAKAASAAAVPPPASPGVKLFGGLGCVLGLLIISAFVCFAGLLAWQATSGWRRPAAPVVAATDLPPRPATYTPVNDWASLLTEAEADSLSGRLRRFYRATTTQLVIVTVPSLRGDEPADYAQRLYHAWGIGQKGSNNGLLVLVASQEHQMRIQTGYGLEGAIPDAIAKRLITNVLTPAFQAKHYYAGLDALATQLMHLAQYETISFEPPPPPPQDYTFGYWLLGVAGTLLLLLLGRYGPRGLWTWAAYLHSLPSTTTTTSSSSFWSSSDSSSSGNSSSDNSSSSGSDSWGGGDSGGGGAGGSW